MDASYITPFVASIQNVFSTMLQLPLEVGEPAIKSGAHPEYDISGIIGMSGDVVGSVVLSFPTDAAVSIVQLFTGTELDAESEDFADAIGELVNMVSGGAKAGFPESKRVSISCPSVVIGKGHRIAGQSDTPCVLIPCSTDCGEVVIEIAIKQSAATAQAA